MRILRTIGAFCAGGYGTVWFVENKQKAMQYVEGVKRQFQEDGREQAIDGLLQRDVITRLENDATFRKHFTEEMYDKYSKQNTTLIDKCARLQLASDTPAILKCHQECKQLAERYLMAVKQLPQQVIQQKLWFSDESFEQLLMDKAKKAEYNYQLQLGKGQKRASKKAAEHGVEIVMSKY
jgi:hypothetical protein